MDNKQWSNNLLQKFDPSFKHRWEVYTDILSVSLNQDVVWVDCGCGDNGMVRRYGHEAKSALGVDALDLKDEPNFIKADLRHIPLPDNYADLVTLRFVVEHFSGVREHAAELKRVIKKGGKVVILTTNLLSPLIFLPRLLLPYWLKSRILTTLFKVAEEDVFPTYHKWNTPGAYRALEKDFILNELKFISDLNYTRKWTFLILLVWHKMTQPKGLNKFRTNMLVVLEKK